ncbi:MAG: GNAT family N-acetyltransferase [Campylobacterales bacterium]|nr:GNAT family N-acetyltransferase [Campylobacterales bacterium]
MSVELLTPSDSKWSAYFYALPSHLQDPYLSAEYYALTSKEAQCFVYTQEENIFFYPFIKTNINALGYDLDKNYYDIEGAYGYNGAIIKDDTEKDFILKAREAFIQYCKDANIIAEFTRFNPLYKNHTYFADMNVVVANQNIIVDLKIEDIWMNSYEHSTRKNVKKAIRSNLTHQIIEAKDVSEADIAIFCDVYWQTMQRNSADDIYFFSRDYFRSIKEKLPNNALFIFISYEHVVISAELVLHNNYVAYSFLGGTLEEYFAYRPNDYLKHLLIETLQNRGLDFFILGGGVNLNDGIFNYKKNFAKNGVHPFYIGKSLYNTEIYHSIVKQWREKVDLSTQEKYSSYLLKYHYGVAD